MATEVTQGDNATPPAGGDESLDAIVAAEFEAAEKAGVDVTPPPGNLDDETPPADKVEAAPGEEPTTETPEKPAGAPATEDEAPDASRARSILAKAEALKAEAAATVETFKRDFAAALRKSPKAALAAHGLPPIDELIDASIAEADGPAAPSAESEIDRRLRAIEAREHDQRIADKRREIGDAIKADKRFATINAKGKSGLVLSFMEAYYAEHKAAITWDKAARIVEDDLRSIVGTPAPKPTPKPAAPARAASPTLENSDTRSAPKPSDEDPTANMSPDKALAWLVEHASA